MCRCLIVVCLLLGTGSTFAGSPVIDGVSLADPFRPDQVTGAKRVAKTIVGPLKLSSILVGRHRRQARINGKPVQVGDSVSGAVVERIERDYVRLIRQGEIVELRNKQSGLVKKQGVLVRK
ncbi:MAG: hypothetical protein CSB48_03140 [Proteobacteria bacterium]|nr:MAG: hypothetical protein CSB48_03140 [Pseudomonadota bacterium]